MWPNQQACFIFELFQKMFSVCVCFNGIVLKFSKDWKTITAIGKKQFVHQQPQVKLETIAWESFHIIPLRVRAYQLKHSISWTNINTKHQMSLFLFGLLSNWFRSILWKDVIDMLWSYFDLIGIYLSNPNHVIKKKLFSICSFSLMQI